MSEEINGNRIRTVILEIVEERSQAPSMQAGSLLREAAERLGIRRNAELERAVLTIWYDLFRAGHLAWGTDIGNPDPPFFHLTDLGRATLEHLSRDPANPDGYLNYLQSIGALNRVARSYIEEGLKTYNSGCYKAAAVMVGAAGESLVLELRDALSNHIVQLSRTPPRNLGNWRIKTVLDAIERELDAHKNSMPRDLAEAFDAFWSAFTQQIRKARNDAGHPSNIAPVTVETVHASLLIFPELVKLVLELKSWLPIGYV